MVIRKFPIDDGTKVPLEGTKTPFPLVDSVVFPPPAGVKLRVVGLKTPVAFAANAPMLGVKLPRVRTTSVPSGDGVNAPVVGLTASRVDNVIAPFAAGVNLPFTGSKPSRPDSEEDPKVFGVKIRVAGLKVPNAVLTIGAWAPKFDMDRLPKEDDIPERIIGIDMDELPKPDEDMPECIIGVDIDVPPKKDAWGRADAEPIERTLWAWTG